MKEITLKNSRGVEYAAKILTPQEIRDAWELYEPSEPLYTWITKLCALNILTLMEDGSGRYIAINL